jgi:hypothetical protein
VSNESSRAEWLRLIAVRDQAVIQQFARPASSVGVAGVSWPVNWAASRALFFCLTTCIIIILLVLLYSENQSHAILSSVPRPMTNF